MGLRAVFESCTIKSCTMLMSHPFMESNMSFTELIPSLLTETPAEGRELAIMLARKTIAAMQSDPNVRAAQRPVYAENAGLLISAGHVVAVEFQTIAAANNYWRP